MKTHNCCLTPTEFVWNSTQVANTASSGRDQHGINFKDRAGNGRAADAGVKRQGKLDTELVKSM